MEMENIVNSSGSADLWPAVKAQGQKEDQNNTVRLKVRDLVAARSFTTLFPTFGIAVIPNSRLALSNATVLQVTGSGVLGSTLDGSSGVPA